MERYEMLIGELSDKSQVSQDTIRHYVEKGLILRERRPGSSFYHYPESAVETLSRIRELRELEMPLDQIGLFLQASRREQVQLLEHHLSLLKERVGVLQEVVQWTVVELERLRGDL